MKSDNLRNSIYSQQSANFRELMVSQRKLLNLSQKGLSEKLGVHHSMIGKIEVGDRRLEILEFINYCKALEVSPCDMIKRIEDIYKAMDEL